VTAIVYSGIRYFKRKSRRLARFHWKRAMVWYGVLAIGLFFPLNWVYQVIRKPGEVLAPVSASLSKSPEFTWRSYGPIFEKYSTNIISPEFLAALAQVEGSGNPIAHTYWRWQWSWNPFEIYRPASSALGMFQVTDGTFAEARKYCIRDHEVVTDGPWYDLSSCWFNSFYARTLASHASEMTAAYLHRSVLASPLRIEERRDPGRARFPGHAGRALRDSQPAAVSRSGRPDEETVCSLEKRCRIAEPGGPTIANAFAACTLRGF
jgi:hypothetical protein